MPFPLEPHRLTSEDARFEHEARSARESGTVLQRFAELPPAERAIRYYTAVSAETCRRSLRKFVRRAWPLIDPKPFIPSWHIDAICDHLAYVALGDIKNLMINIPPRMTKSSIVSVAFPAWVWCDEPEIQFLCASYAADLARLDAAKMRRLVESKWYMDRYPHVVLLADENRVDRFSNTMGGYRTSISVGSKTTGLGGDILILDDPHNAQEVESEAKRKGTIEWHDNAFRSRVNDPNKARRVYVGQRTHDGDVFGHVLALEEKRWVHLCLPMEYDGSRKCVTYINRGDGPEGEPIFRDPREQPNSLLCPERMGPEAVAREKEAVSARTWAAQYQQQPQGAGGRILKRSWWRLWEWPDWHPEYRKSERPLPDIFFVLQAYDTAFENDEQDSYTVRTTWGMFHHEELARKPGQGETARVVSKSQPRISAILLERRKWRPSFGEMLDEAIESAKTWEPDRILVEKKASGHSLIQEMRRKGLPVRAVKVQGDLVYRAHMASLPLEKGAIWYVNRKWAKDLIETCAKFPDVDFDDEVSSVAIALQYMRMYMDLQLEDEDDNKEDLDLFSPKLQRKSFYG
ncbi:MAG: hypothetical protein C0P74_015675 [Gammaproteobacteria bacterium]